MADFIYLCPECGNCFSSETSLQEHGIAAHSFQNHVCPVCHEGFQNPELLKLHASIHPNLHSCSTCGELCENKLDVYIHVTTLHKYGGKIVCDLCSETFSTNSSLKVHFINKHTEERIHIPQKLEVFCNAHSSGNLCGLDALKDSLYPFVDSGHPKEKESRNEIESVCISNASKSNQSILPSEKMDDERLHDCSGSAVTELQAFLQECGNKDSWYTKDTDHISSYIRPSDILERIQSLNKNKLQKNQSIKCHVCDTTFNDGNDCLLAHDVKDPSNVYPHKQEEKPVSQLGLKDLVEFRKFIARNEYSVPSKNSIKERLSDKTVVINQVKNTSVESQNDQLEPNDTFFSGVSALRIQNLDENESSKNQNQSEPSCVLMAEISALTIQNKRDDAIVFDESKSMSGSNSI